MGVTKRVTPLRKIVCVLFAFATLRRFGGIGAGVLPVGYVALPYSIYIFRTIRQTADSDGVVDRFQFFNFVRFNPFNDQLDSIGLALKFSRVIFESLNRLLLEILCGHLLDSVCVLVQIVTNFLSTCNKLFGVFFPRNMPTKTVATPFFFKK